MPYYPKGKCVYKKDTNKKVGCTKGPVKNYLAALHAATANESLDTRSVGSNLEFKSVIPNIDNTEASVFYKLKSDPGADLVLVFSLGESPEDADYQYGAIIDRNDRRGRPKRFQDPAAEETTQMLKVYRITSDDVEMAGQDAYEQIEQHLSSVPKLKDPYEEKLAFFDLFKKVISE